MKEFEWNSDFSKDMGRLFAIVGEEMFWKIIQEFGGQCIYFPQKYMKEYRNFLIQRDYFKNGVCVRALAEKWDLSLSGIRYILNRPLGK